MPGEGKNRQNIFPENLIKRIRTMIRAPIRKILGGTEEAWARVGMNRETDRYVRSLNVCSMDSLEISGDGWGRLPFRSYRSVHFE